MADPENPNQPLLVPPCQQPAGSAGAPDGRRSSRAYKVAGLTLLACVLIMGQAMIAYFLLSQRSDIKSLEEQNNNLKTKLTKGSSVSVPMQMHVPMNTMTELMDDSVDEEASTGAPGKIVPLQGTICQMEASGMKPVQVPGFRPACDEAGLYRARQCYMGQCWCVDRVSGEQIPGSLSNGSAKCAAVHTAGMSKMLKMLDVNA
ncbi:CD74 molecule, major histocompatibility complex, class II invariant chain b [Trachinotus anak]|uniref:CD74 molecule, major histocompatibility complex, class II invariant chain b n=1 Tax=Trachinotus anak TaxID=443729 RepID=UPI0039F1B266